MNVIALVDFHDNLKGVDRKRGEQFVVSKERFDEINAVGEERIGKPIVGEIEERRVPEEHGEKSRAKRRTARKAQ